MAVPSRVRDVSRGGRKLDEEVSTMVEEICRTLKIDPVYDIRKLVDEMIRVGLIQESDVWEFIH